MKKIKLNVVILTYNHQNYIANTLESVFNQTIDFDMKIIVADDGSSDSTIEIVLDFVQKYPNKIQVLKHKSKQGILKNILRIVPEITSEYIAILDGDDYWTFDQKLQKQVDFLDSNIDFSGIFHDTKIENTVTEGNQYFQIAKCYSQRYAYHSTIDLVDVIARQMIIPSSSFVFRSDFLSNLDLSYLVDQYSTLWKLTVFSMQGRKIKYIDDVWSVYRNHDNGISKRNFIDFHFSHIRFLENSLKLKAFSSYKYEIYQAIVNEYKIILDSKENKPKSTFIHYFVAELNKIKQYRKKLNEINKRNS